MNREAIEAAKVLLADKEAFAVMVDVAEETNEARASFNVVIGNALRALLATGGSET